jgi:hypothetical protein
MPDEHWATFSIYDHRTDLYRRALLLFDRIVVPIPESPIGRLTTEEIDSLSADVDYLQQNDAAVRFKWDQARFQSWQQSVASEALATMLNNDRQFASRLHIAANFNELIPPGAEPVTAVPVYHDPATFDAAANELKNDVQEAPLLEIVFPRLPVPDGDASLASIVEFRNTEQFRDSLYHLRKWQNKILPEILNEPNALNRDRTLRRAAADFDRWIGQYSEAMSDAKMGKVRTAVISVLAVGAVLSPWSHHVIATLSALASPLFSLRELRKPCWKIVSEKECAPAAVVYAAERI